MRTLTRLFLPVLAGLVLSQPVAAQSVKLVANAGSSLSALTKDEVSKVFLKRVSAVGGAPVVPVDQAESSPVRKAFSKELLGRDVASVTTFWQQQIFAGRGTPPAQKPGDAEVLAFVRATPNAIGYIAAGTDPGAGVRVVSVN